MLLTLGRGMAGVGRAAKDAPDARLPLSNIESSCVFDLDATLAGSYAGSGALWKNIVPAPADGALPGAYDFMFGNGSAPASYPVFQGAGGARDAYWAMNGGNYFTVQAMLNTAYLAGLQRTDRPGQAYSVFMALRFSNADNLSIQTLCGTSAATSMTGLRLITLRDQGDALSLYQRGDSNNTSSGAPRPTLSGNTDYVVGISRLSDGTVTRLWVNDLSVESAHAGNPCASDAANPFQIGANGLNTGRFSGGTRLYAASLFNKFLSDQSARKIIAAYRQRHSRAYDAAAG